MSDGEHKGWSAVSQVLGSQGPAVQQPDHSEDDCIILAAKSTFGFFLVCGVVAALIIVSIMWLVGSLMQSSAA